MQGEGGVEGLEVRGEEQRPVGELRHGVRLGVQGYGGQSR